MSYTIPNVERQFAQLSAEDRDSGFARLFPYYDNVRRFNGSLQISQFLGDPNLNKILEFCSYNHNQLTIPDNLSSLKEDVSTFFSGMFGAVEDEHLRKNLFTHFLMRECNKKTIPISDTAIKNVYQLVFGSELKPKVIVHVSNYCGLYYTTQSPFKYLVDTDNFDDIFEQTEGKTTPVKEKAETVTYTESILKYLNPKGMLVPITAKNLSRVILYVARMHFHKQPFTTETLITALCAEYQIKEDIWGQYLNYNKSQLRQTVSSTLCSLRTKGLLKKSGGRKNLVTSLGLTTVKGYLKEYNDSKSRIFTNKKLTYKTPLLSPSDTSFTIANTWDKKDNHLEGIVLLAHYDLNAERSTESAVEINFSTLSDHICERYEIDENIWGQYLNHNRTVFKKQLSTFKGRLISNGFLERTGTSKSTITQIGVEMVESWLITNEDPIEDPSTESTDTVELSKDVGTVINSIKEPVEKADLETEDITDSSDTLDSAEHQQVLLDWSEYDTLTNQLGDLNTTVETLINFIKEKNLLSEYIISISKGNTIPF